MSDVGDALALYRAIAGVESDGTERAAYFVIPGAPISKSRVRFGRGHAYSGAEAREAERRTATYMRAAMGARPYLGNVAVGCIFYRPNFQRIDVDNLLKHICDSANGVAWKDDSQVTAIFGRAELDRENPRTVVVLGPHRSTLLRGINDETPCATCGKPVSAVGKRGAREPKRYCSQVCAAQGRRVDLSAPVPCAHCQQPFRRRTSAQRMCSPECRADNLRNVHKSRARKLSDCATCGKTLGHGRGGRCRDCWRANPTGVVA